MNAWLEVPRGWLDSFGEIARFGSRVAGLVYSGRVLRFFGEALRQCGILILSSTLVIWGLVFIIGLQCGIEGAYFQRSVGAPLGPFFATLLTNASTVDLWGSIVKTTLFGAIIAVVCCYKGMTASGGAEGVGRAVNQAVVIAFLGVFAFNYVFTQTLLATHPEITVIR